MVSRSGQPATVSQTPTRMAPPGVTSMLLDHAQLGDRAVDLRVIDGRERLGYLLRRGQDNARSRLALSLWTCPHATAARGVPIQVHPAPVCSGGVTARACRSRRTTPGRARQQPPVPDQGPRAGGGRGVPRPGGRRGAGPRRRRAGRRWRQALRDGGWGTKTRAVRVNDVTTGWAYRDVVDVVEQAGECAGRRSCCRRSPARSTWPGWTCCSARSSRPPGSRPGGSGSRRRSRTRAGLAAVDAIAAASPRLEALVFGRPISWPAWACARWSRRAARRVRGGRRVPLRPHAHPGGRTGERAAGRSTARSRRSTT